MNLFGPGRRANATIGRALRLVILNCLGAQPGVLDRSTQGHPGKYTFCVAELEDESPWEPLHVERGFPRDASTVTVFAAEAPHNVLTHYGHDAEAILVTLADAMAGLGSFSPGQSFLVLAPEHVRILARDGWTKPRLRRRSTRARRSLADLKRAGKVPGPAAPDDEARFVHRGEACRTSSSSSAGAGRAGIPPSSRPGAGTGTASWSPTPSADRHGRGCQGRRIA